MPGGPVNGSAFYGLSKDSKAIIVPTVLQMATDALNYWTSITCLYDRWWEPDSDKVTLPICMFHVKKITPTRTVETSKKRVILYEPQQDNKADTKDVADQMRRGVVQTIVDNAVKQPTTYNVEAIVPFQPVSRYVTEGLKMIPDMVTAMSDLVGGDVSAKFTDVWETAFSSVFAVNEVIGQVAEYAGKLPSMDNVSFINMNSLEAMADSCRTLCMKMWTGFDYKYVIITGMTQDKQPTEDDVFRVSLTLQEMPVLTIARPGDAKPPAIKRNFAVTAISATQSALVAPLIGWTGVKKAANDTLSAKDMIGDMLYGR